MWDNKVYKDEPNMTAFCVFIFSHFSHIYCSLTCIFLARHELFWPRVQWLYAVHVKRRVFYLRDEHAYVHVALVPNEKPLEKSPL